MLLLTIYLCRNCRACNNSDTRNRNTHTPTKCHESFNSAIPWRWSHSPGRGLEGPSRGRWHGSSAPESISQPLLHPDPPLRSRRRYPKNRSRNSRSLYAFRNRWYHSSRSRIYGVTPPNRSDGQGGKQTYLPRLAGNMLPSSSNTPPARRLSIPRLAACRTHSPGTSRGLKYTTLYFVFLFDTGMPGPRPRLQHQ